MDIPECGVCLREFGDGDGMALVMRCGHSFCRACYAVFKANNPLVYLNNNGFVRCPDCRAPACEFERDPAVNYALMRAVDAMRKYQAEQKQAQPIAVAPPPPPPVAPAVIPPPVRPPEPKRRKIAFSIISNGQINASSAIITVEGGRDMIVAGNRPVEVKQRDGSVVQLRNSIFSNGDLRVPINIDLAGTDAEDADLVGCIVGRNGVNLERARVTYNPG